MNLPYQAGYYWILRNDNCTQVCLIMNNECYESYRGNIIDKEMIVAIGKRLKHPKEFLEIQKQLNNSKSCPTQQKHPSSNLKKVSSPRRLRLGT